jgi:hypothetical protein
MEHFLQAGTIFPSENLHSHWLFVYAGPACTPCSMFKSVLREEIDPGLEPLGIRSSLTSSKYTLLQRKENVGMDLASHNTSITYMTYKQRLWDYK